MITYSYGSALVGMEEIVAKAATGEVGRFLTTLKTSPAASLDFSTGTLSANDLSGGPEFVAVELYKPLRVEIRQVYTGSNPHSFLGLGSKGMLVASAMKGITSYDAAPRAINFLRGDAAQHTAYREVAATDVGTPLVFYTKALTSVSTVISLEMIFQSFPSELFKTMTKLFNAASSIPVFAPASGYLIAAGTVSKIVGDLGKALFDGKPAFKQTEPISFITPGTKLPTARFVLLTNNSSDPSIYQKYKIDDTGALVSISDGAPYKGDEPYIIIFLDGREVSDYEKFQPTAASAAILDRFYNIGTNVVQPADSLIEAMQLFSDMKYRKEADGLAQQISSLPAGSPQLDEKQAKLNALIANISNNLLKPKTGS